MIIDVMNSMFSAVNFWRTGSERTSSRNVAPSLSSS